VPMPIVDAVAAVLSQKLTIDAAIEGPMARPKRREAATSGGASIQDHLDKRRCVLRGPPLRGGHLSMAVLVNSRHGDRPRENTPHRHPEEPAAERRASKDARTGVQLPVTFACASSAPWEAGPCHILELPALIRRPRECRIRVCSNDAYER
jgi:hypothetical protein